MTETDNLRELLARQVETSRADLVESYRRALRETLFTNRSNVRPNMLGPLAAGEAEAFVRFLAETGFSPIEYGRELCKVGLSTQAVGRLGQVTRQFLLSHLSGELLAAAISFADTYYDEVIQGYVDSRELLILNEQEQIRSALQTAIKHFTVEIKEVELMAQKANEANEFKSRFIARISHELRTPLGALMGMAEMLKENVYGPLSPAQLDITQRIFNNTIVLKQVFSELLDQSQLDAGQLHLKEEPYSPRTLVETVCSNYLPMALQKGLAMHTEIAAQLPASAVGDRARVEQVLSNLVVNAIKFTSAGSVTICASANGNSQWMFQVKDTGIGIAPENQAHIFEAFRQVEETTSRKYGGVGLGLSIVQQLISAMQGSVSVESKLGQGSTFTVVLPLQPAKSGN